MAVRTDSGTPTGIMASNARLLGALTTLGCGLMAIAAVGIEFRAGEFSPRWAVALVLTGMVLLYAGPIGIRGAGAFGSSKLGTAGFLVTMLGITAWVVGVTSFLVRPSIEWDQPLTPIGAILTALGMLMLGGAVLRARRWTGWARFTPLVVGLAYLVVIPIQVLIFFPATGDASFLVLGAWYLTWIGVGAALRQATAE